MSYFEIFIQIILFLIVIFVVLKISLSVRQRYVVRKVRRALDQKKIPHGHLSDVELATYGLKLVEEKIKND